MSQLATIPTIWLTVVGYRALIRSIETGKEICGKIYH